MLVFKSDLKIENEKLSREGELPFSMANNDVLSLPNFPMSGFLSVCLASNLQRPPAAFPGPLPACSQAAVL